MNIYFNEKYKTIQELRHAIASSLVELTFLKISKSMEICMNKTPEKWYDTFQLLYKHEEWYRDFTKYTDCICVDLNIDTLFEYKITCEQIARNLCKVYDDLVCIFSPIQLGKFYIYVDTTNVVLPQNRLLFIDASNCKNIYLEESVQPALEKIILFGIENIANLYYRETNGEWIVETDGSNYQAVLGLDFIDKTRTISNNIWDIYEVLGIEATREFLINEFCEIMDGINICHIKLLVERMTFQGTIGSITRYTMRKEDSGPLGKASFEETLDNFLKASASGEVEPTAGVSASIICGKRANIGTGMMDIIIDVDKFT